MNETDPAALKAGLTNSLRLADPSVGWCRGGRGSHRGWALPRAWRLTSVGKDKITNVIFLLTDKVLS